MQNLNFPLAPKDEVHIGFLVSLFRCRAKVDREDEARKKSVVIQMSKLESGSLLQIDTITINSLPFSKIKHKEVK